MFDIGAPELLLCVIVAVLVIGPKDLPAALRMAGRWVAQGRGVMRQFRSGFDAMVREAEMEELEKKWAADNARIIKESADIEPMRQIEAAKNDAAAPDDEIIMDDVDKTGVVPSSDEKQLPPQQLKPDSQP
jgi:sec-independent protein translocase protein TatB